MSGGMSTGDGLVAASGPTLRKNLTGAETIRLNVHQHPVVLTRPIGWALLATLVMVLMMTGERGWLPPALLLAVIGSWLWVGYKEYERRHNSFVATNKRIMKVEGILHLTVPMMRHSKVTDMSLDQPLIGRMLGFGSITIESAGQNQPIRDVRYVRYPTQTYRRLCEIIFDEEYPEMTPAQLRADQGWIRHLLGERLHRRRRAVRARRPVGGSRTLGRSLPFGRTGAEAPSPSTPAGPAAPHTLSTRRTTGGPALIRGKRGSSEDTAEIPVYRRPGRARTRRGRGPDDPPDGHM